MNAPRALFRLPVLLVLFLGPGAVAQDIPLTHVDPIMDTGITIINRIRQMQREQELQGHVFEQKARYMREMHEQIDQLTAWEREIRQAQDRHQQQLHQLEQDRRSAMLDAQGDRAREAEVEAEFERRTAELQEAGGLLEEARASAPDIRQNLEIAMRTLREAQTASDWYGRQDRTGRVVGPGQAQLFNRANESLQQRMAAFEEITARAADLQARTSSLDTEREHYGAFVGRVERVSGDVEFYSGGRRLQAGSEVPVGGDRQGMVRALLVGDRRTYVRDLEANPARGSSITSRTDHALTFAVNTGSFSGETTWTVGAERYEWSMTSRTERPLQTSTRRSSGVPEAVAGDEFVFVVPEATGSETLHLFVTGDAEWRMVSERPAGRVEDTDNDHATGEIVIQILPRR